MNKILLSFLFILLIACNKEKKESFTSIAPELGNVIDEYITNNPNNDIYYLIFENRCNKQFFTIQSFTDCYDSNCMDGCFMRKGKIIIFWSVNRSWKDSLLHLSQEELCNDSLTKYTDYAKENVDYDAPCNPLTYQILSANHYKKANKTDWSYTEAARDSNVICSSALNRIVNDYINTNGSPNIVYLRFNNLNGDDFVSIGHDFVYDPKSFSGMFYRNQRIIVIYSIEEIKQKDIIDKRMLLPMETICDYKSQKREYPKFPEKKYRIVSKRKIEQVSSSDKNCMDV